VFHALSPPIIFITIHHIFELTAQRRESPNERVCPKIFHNYIIITEHLQERKIAIWHTCIAELKKQTAPLSARSENAAVFPVQ